MDWKAELQKTTKTHGDAPAADKAARRIFRGLGFTNMDKRLAYRETVLCIDPPEEWTKLRRVMQIWATMADHQQNEKLYRLLRRPLIRTEDSKTHKAAEKMRNLPPTDGHGNRYFRFTEDSMLFVGSYDDYVWLPRPVRLFAHDQPGKEVVCMDLYDFAKFSMKREELDAET
jgi:hypothetical protein